MESQELITKPDGYDFSDVPARRDGDPEQPITLEDFHSYAPENVFIFVPTRQRWPGTSVNARIAPIPTGRFRENGSEIKQKATEWLSQNRSVEQMTWAPGLPMLIENRIIANGGIIERPGLTTFNLYQPPTIEPGDPDDAGPWIEHIETVYPAEAEHLIDWLAYKVQRPGDKINHAIVLGGAQGIGKDTILEPVSRAVGPWNFADVTPSQLMGQFVGFVKSVILRVSEARDLGDKDRYGLYEHMKIYTAAPPDVLRVDEKFINEYYVKNVCGVVITTNHIASGIYIPADDRRHFVAWSEKTKDDFSENYWRDIWQWYDRGGYENITAFLLSRDLSAFDPKAPPPKTAAFWRMVDAGRAPEDAEMADCIEALTNPDAVTVGMIASKATGDFYDWLHERRNRRQIPHRLEEVGYVPVRNSNAKDGLFKVSGKRAVIYAKKELSIRDRIKAANDLTAAEEVPF